MTTGYATFHQRRQELTRVLDALAQDCQKVGAQPRAAELLKAKEALLKENFRLMVVGEFKRGKSTLINALLGCDVLPAKVAPCTAVITHVRYGDQKKAVLYYKDSSRQPTAVPFEELKKLVTIQDSDVGDEDDADAGVDKSPYRRAVVYYPLPLLRQNVEIVDSPGLNEHKSRTNVALEFLDRADVMVVVLSCQQALSQSELEFIRNELKGHNLRNVFFLWNHYDIVQDSPEDRADIQKRSRQYLEQKLGSADRIFYLSAKSALQGRKSGNPDLVATSNLPKFEAALERFLSTERARVKLLNPLRRAEDAVRELLLEHVPQRENLLKQPLELLRKRLEQQRPRLDEVERLRASTLQTIERRREFVIREIETSYRNLMSELENGLRVQAGNIEVGSLQAMFQRGNARKQMEAQLHGWMKEKSVDWSDTVLQKLVVSHMSALESDLNERAKVFLKSLDAVRAAFSGDIPKTEVLGQDVTPLSRVLGGVGGFFIGGIGSAVEGASLGVGQMARGLGIHIAASVGLIVMGFGLPVVLPALVVIGIVRTLVTAKSEAARLRADIVKTLTEGLRNAQPTMEGKLRDQIAGFFTKLSQEVDAGMNIMIDEVRGQIQAIIKEREGHENAANNELAVLQQVRLAILEQSKAIKQLRAQIDTMG